MKNLLKMYQENQKEADLLKKNKKDLLLMLYGGVIDNLRNAKHAMLEKDVGMKIEKIDKALSIIEIGLLTTLNKEIEKNIYEDLECFYQDACSQIILANKQNDIKKLQEVEDLFVNLKKCWESTH